MPTPTDLYALMYGGSLRHSDGNRRYFTELARVAEIREEALRGRRSLAEEARALNVLGLSHYTNALNLRADLEELEQLRNSNMLI